MARFRQTLVFDRFPARIFREFGDHAILKGGAVLEIRLAQARMTRDVDLRVSGSPDDLLKRLRAACDGPMNDYLEFVVERDAEHPTIEGDGMVYEGQRYRVEGRLADRLYGFPFGLDIAFGDTMSEEPEVVDGSQFFDFIGIPPTQLRLYPRETLLAEKVHAYTIPRPRENSRVKDLPDMALLAQTGPFEAMKLRDALRQTFGFRQSHDLPHRLPDPPASWPLAYKRMAEKNDLQWRNIDALLLAVRAFLDPVLAGHEGRWEPESWSWF